MLGRYVQVDDKRVYLREWGEGPPILLLHGFPQTGECWNEVAARLGGSYRLIAPDAPGFGNSDPPDVSRPRDVAAIMVGLLDELELEQAVVVGHDWGGAFAFSMALEYPERVSHLVVTNSPFRKVDLLRAFHVPLLSFPVLPEVAFAITGGRLVSLILRAGSSNKEPFGDDKVSHYAAAYSSAHKVRPALRFYRESVRFAVMKKLRTLDPRAASVPIGRGAIEVPTLIVWGLADFVLPRSLMDGIEQHIPNVTIVDLPGCGHFVPEECPDGLADAIARFLQPVS